MLEIRKVLIVDFSACDGGNWQYKFWVNLSKLVKKDGEYFWNIINQAGDGANSKELAQKIARDLARAYNVDILYKDYPGEKFWTSCGQEVCFFDERDLSC